MIQSNVVNVVIEVPSRAGLFEAVATGHGFNDGNKRTAVILTDLLLSESGRVLESIGEEDLDKAVEEFAVEVVNHEHGFDQIVAWFKARIRLERPNE